MDTAEKDVPSDESSDFAPEATTVRTGTRIAIWVLYVLGLLAAFVFVASAAFVAIAYATTGDGGFGLDVSLPALVVWAALLIAAAGTWLWRRSQGRE
jgi:hypothetical protein